MRIHCGISITSPGGWRRFRERTSGVQFAARSHEIGCCIPHLRKRRNERYGCGSSLHMSVGLVRMSSQFSSATKECSLKRAATGCRTATPGGVSGSRVRRIVPAGMVRVRPNNTLVPTRNGEAPLLAAQRGRWALT